MSNTTERPALAGQVDRELGLPLPKREVLSVVAEWALAGHITERGVTCEAGDAIRAAVAAEVVAERNRCASICENIGDTNKWSDAHECARAICGHNVEVTGPRRRDHA